MRFEIERANGEERHIVISGQPVNHVTDPTTAWRGAMTDVTADVTRERERYRERTMIGLGALVGSIAHEINNLLHPIVNLSRLAMERATTDSETRRLLGIVADFGRRAGEIVSNVLGLSRARDERAVAPFGQALNEALQALQTFGGAQMAIDWRIETFEGPSVRPTQVFQVVSNLAANAARAMNYAGVVKVRYGEIGADGAGRRFRLVVSDTGVGMSEEVKRQAFEPFFSMAGSAGSGLGLSIVRSAVEDMGGGIEVVSCSGKGTDVVITLPISVAEIDTRTDP